MKHRQEKSDPLIRAKKPVNKPGQPGAEPVEQRRGAEGNTVEPRNLVGCLIGRPLLQGRRAQRTWGGKMGLYGVVIPRLDFCYHLCCALSGNHPGSA